MSPEYLSPGVYVEEVDRGTKPIEGVGTAMAAFVGFAEKGPVNQPVFIPNWMEFVNTFGGFVEGVYLAPAVYGYFQNGGGRCYVTRLPGGEEGAAEPKAETALPTQGCPEPVRWAEPGEDDEPPEGVTVVERDRDGDGVPDGDDACPEEAGLPEDEGCPPPDPAGDEPPTGVWGDLVWPGLLFGARIVPPATLVEVQVLEFEVYHDYTTINCYLSLAGSDVERHGPFEPLGARHAHPPIVGELVRCVRLVAGVWQ